ncbi:MAG: hypothetical protein ABIQ01_11065 [Pseudolysinimonas sp.]
MSTRFRTRALAAIFAVTTGALALIATPAQAGPRDDPDRSCWLNADTSVVQCFADEEELVDAVTDTGRVLIEGGTAARLPAGLRALFVLTRFYDGGGYTSGTFVVTSASSTTCVSGSVSGDLTGFNDKVSSFHSYYGCQTKIFANTGSSGASFGLIADAASVGALDNLASSFLIT